MESQESKFLAIKLALAVLIFAFQPKANAGTCSPTRLTYADGTHTDEPAGIDWQTTNVKIWNIFGGYFNEYITVCYNSQWTLCNGTTLDSCNFDSTSSDTQEIGGNGYLNQDTSVFSCTPVGRGGSDGGRGYDSGMECGWVDLGESNYEQVKLGYRPGSGASRGSVTIDYQDNGGQTDTSSRGAGGSSAPNYSTGGSSYNNDPNRIVVTGRLHPENRGFISYSNNNYSNNDSINYFGDPGKGQPIGGFLNPETAPSQGDSSALTNNNKEIVVTARRRQITGDRSNPLLSIIDGLQNDVQDNPGDPYKIALLKTYLERVNEVVALNETSKAAQNRGNQSHADFYAKQAVELYNQLVTDPQSVLPYELWVYGLHHHDAPTGLATIFD